MDRYSIILGKEPPPPPSKKECISKEAVQAYMDRNAIPSHTPFSMGYAGAQGYTGYQGITGVQGYGITGLQRFSQGVTGHGYIETPSATFINSYPTDWDNNTNLNNISIVDLTPTYSLGPARTQNNALTITYADGREVRVATEDDIIALRREFITQPVKISLINRIKSLFKSFFNQINKGKHHEQVRR